jgi:hypothetical protein
MESNTNPEDKTDRQEAEVSQVPPKTNPKNAAGSLNPRERTAFYEAVVQKGPKGPGNRRGPLRPRR